MNPVDERADDKRFGRLREGPTRDHIAKRSSMRHVLRTNWTPSIEVPGRDLTRFNKLAIDKR